jgi:hypothetical protein
MVDAPGGGPGRLAAAALLDRAQDAEAPGAWVSSAPWLSVSTTVTRMTAADISQRRRAKLGTAGRSTDPASDC